jgi:NAD(P)-dependent dehydrogenase (short-subunit alcohol dehydrogenase family)
MSGRPRTVLLRGTETALGEVVATTLLARGATVALHDPALAGRLAERDLPGQIVDLTPWTEPGTEPDSDPRAPFAALHAHGHLLDAVVHLYLPDATTDEAALLAYTGRLRPILNAAAEHMQDTGRQGIIINQFLMPTLFVDHPLASAMVEARNGLTALTRFACVRYGRAGIRTTSLQVGLLELPSLRALVSARVAAAKTPLGRWITPQEVAGTLAFLSLDSGYMSGQMLVLDGGMTGGLNGV